MLKAGGFALANQSGIVDCKYSIYSRSRPSRLLFKQSSLIELETLAFLMLSSPLDGEVGKWVSFDDLQQSYLVVVMEPLRDVEQRLRQSRSSPLAKLLTTADIPEAEQNTLVDGLVKASDTISASNTISAVGTSIKASMDSTAGKAFTMDVAVGMSAPSFTDISRSLTA